MKFVIINILVLFSFSCVPVSKNLYFDKEKLHHTPYGFINPYLDLSKHKKNFSDFYKMIKTERPKIPENKQISLVDKNDLNEKIKKGQNFYLWIGHSTILLHINGKIILTDPIFSDRCSPVQFAGPKRYTDPAIDIEDLPKIDIIVISHNHYDHLDYNTVKLIGDSTMWFVPLGLKKWFNKNGVRNVIELDWYENKNKNGILVSCLPSQHWSKRTLLDSFDTLWASWAIEIEDFKFWFAGDTGYNNIQFKEIGDLYGPFDLAAIPIGAYEPRWFMKNFHINPDEAVKIHKDVKSRKSIGIHYGTFILTTEPIDQPPKMLKSELKKSGISHLDFLAIGIGEMVLI